MQKIIYIPVDTSINNTVECNKLIKRGDILTLQIKVFNNSVLADLTGQSIDLILKKSDGTLIEKTITSIANGVITASLDVQATNVTGLVDGEVQVYDANGQSSTNTFTFVVDTSLADDVLAKSQDSIETLTQLKSIITDGNTAIQKYKDNVIQIAGTATSVEALAGTKLYIDNNLSTLQNENAKAVTNIATEKTQNDKATSNITELTSLNLSADTLNIDLESNIAIVTILNDDIESNITTGNTLKTGLETKITDGTTLKTNLDASISTGNTLKTDLGIANIQAEANITAMEGFGDVTVLTQDVTNIKTEMQNARNGEANLDTRLDKMDTSIAKNTTQLSDLTNKLGIVPIDGGTFFETYVDWQNDGGTF